VVFPGFTFSTQFEYTVTVAVTVPDPTAGATGFVTGTDSIIVTVKPSALRLLINGGRLWHTTVFKPLTIDATESFDPDKTSQALRWQFDCRPLHAVWWLPCELPVQPVLEAEVSGNLSLPSGFVTPGTYEFIITLFANPDDGRSTTSNVTLIVVTTPTLDLSIAALSTHKVNPNIRLVLAGSLPGLAASHRHRAQWMWTVVAGDLNLATSTASAITNPELVVKPDVLTSGQTMRMRLQATLDGVSGLAEVEFLINGPPTSGTCSVNPTVGKATFTDFELACVDWVDDTSDLPFSYDFAIIEVGTLAEKPLGKRSPVNFVISVLPEGPDVTGEVVLQASVLDILESRSIVRMVTIVTGESPLNAQKTGYLPQVASKIANARASTNADVSLQIASAVAASIHKHEPGVTVGPTVKQELVDTLSEVVGASGASQQRLTGAMLALSETMAVPSSHVNGLPDANIAETALVVIEDAITISSNIGTNQQMAEATLSAMTSVLADGAHATRIIAAQQRAGAVRSVSALGPQLSVAASTFKVVVDRIVASITALGRNILSSQVPGAAPIQMGTDIRVTLLQNTPLMLEGLLIPVTSLFNFSLPIEAMKVTGDQAGAVNVQGIALAATVDPYRPISTRQMALTSSVVVDDALTGVAVANPSLSRPVLVHLIRDTAPLPLLDGVSERLERCVFLDHSTGVWSTTGLLVDNVSGDGSSMQCSSYHLSDFTALAGNVPTEIDVPLPPGPVTEEGRLLPLRTLPVVIVVILTIAYVVGIFLGRLRDKRDVIAFRDHPDKFFNAKILGRVTLHAATDPNPLSRVVRTIATRHTLLRALYVMPYHALTTPQILSAASVFFISIMFFNAALYGHHQSNTGAIIIGIYGAIIALPAPFLFTLLFKALAQRYRVRPKGAGSNKAGAYKYRNLPGRGTAYGASVAETKDVRPITLRMAKDFDPTEFKSPKALISPRELVGGVEEDVLLREARTSMPGGLDGATTAAAAAAAAAVGAKGRKRRPMPTAAARQLAAMGLGDVVENRDVEPVGGKREVEEGAGRWTAEEQLHAAMQALKAGSYWRQRTQSMRNSSGTIGMRRGVRDANMAVELVASPFVERERRLPYARGWMAYGLTLSYAAVALYFALRYALHFESEMAWGWLGACVTSSVLFVGFLEPLRVVMAEFWPDVVVKVTGRDLLQERRERLYERAEAAERNRRRELPANRARPPPAPAPAPTKPSAMEMPPGRQYRTPELREARLAAKEAEAAAAADIAVDWVAQIPVLDPGGLPGMLESPPGQADDSALSDLLRPWHETSNTPLAPRARLPPLPADAVTPLPPLPAFSEEDLTGTMSRDDRSSSGSDAADDTAAEISAAVAAVGGEWRPLTGVSAGGLSGVDPDVDNDEVARALELAIQGGGELDIESEGLDTTTRGAGLTSGSESEGSASVSSEGDEEQAGDTTAEDYRQYLQSLVDESFGGDEGVGFAIAVWDKENSEWKTGE